jgi:hypothetical protein
MNADLSYIILVLSFILLTYLVDLWKLENDESYSMSGVLPTIKPSPSVVEDLVSQTQPIFAMTGDISPDPDTSAVLTPSGVDKILEKITSELERSPASIVAHFDKMATKFSKPLPPRLRKKTKSKAKKRKSK